MSITNIFISHDKTERLLRQSELHRRCILLLQAKRAKS